MQVLNKFNERICFYCVVIDIYNNYALVIPLKEKKDMLAMLFKDSGT